MSFHDDVLARRAKGLSLEAASSSHELISFGSGHALESLLPDLRDAANLALSEYRAESLQYGPRRGLPDLREWLTQYLAEDGTDVGTDELIIVNGAKHGLELICRLLLDEGDAVIVTAPTYFTAIPILRSFNAQVLEVGQDSEGMDVEDLTALLSRVEREGGRRPKFIYDVPDFHNPTGRTMSRQRRESLVAIAARAGISIVEDSPYRSVRFEGAPVPSLKSLAGRNGNVFGLGTFSKLLAPGLRIGWVSASTDLITRMTQLKSDGGTCPMTQRMIVEFCRAGGLAAHALKVRHAYREQRDALLAALGEHLPEITTSVPDGGYYLWASLPPHLDAADLARAAAARGVEILPGSLFYAGAANAASDNQRPPRNHLRLAYSSEPVDRIREGIVRLADAYHEIIGR